MTFSRAILSLTLAAALAACAADTPETAPGSANTTPAVETPVIDAPATPLADPEPGDTLITPDGWGPLRIGMSRAEVVAAGGDDANPEAVGGPEPDACDEFRPANAPDGVLVMIERDVLTRISVSRNADILTPGGFRVGDTGAAVIAKHGADARVELHKYLEAPAKYVTIWREPSESGERRGIRYEINGDDEIVHIRAGGASIEYVEGCL